MVGEGVEGQTTTNLSNHLEEKRACMVADNNSFLWKPRWAKGLKAGFSQTFVCSVNDL